MEFVIAALFAAAFIWISVPRRPLQAAPLRAASRRAAAQHALRG